MKDEDNSLFPKRQPGPLAAMLGARVEQFYALDQAVPVNDGQPAAVTRKVGRGTITYIGTALDATAMRRASEWMLKESGVATVLPEIPEDVDVAIRSSEKTRVLILTNYGSEMRVIKLPRAMHDVLKGGDTTSVSLPRFAVVVLQESASTH